MTFKQKIIKFLTPVLLPIVRLYWFIFRPKIFGAKVIIRHGDEILMIRNSYGYKSWTFPGGKIDRGEQPKETAMREVKEEVGIDLVDIERIGTFMSRAEYARDTVHVFTARANTKEFVLDPFEIEEVRWFHADSFPKTGPIARTMITMYDKFNT